MAVTELSSKRCSRANKVTEIGHGSLAFNVTT